MSRRNKFPRSVGGKMRKMIWILAKALPVSLDISLPIYNEVPEEPMFRLLPMVNSVILIRDP